MLSFVIAFFIKFFLKLFISDPRAILMNKSPNNIQSYQNKCFKPNFLCFMYLFLLDFNG